MKSAMWFLRANVLAFGLIGPMVVWADMGKLNRLVVELRQQGRYGEAIPVAQLAVAEAEASFGKSDIRLSAYLNNLAFFYAKMNRYDEALPLYRQALGIRKKELGADHPDVAASLNNLGTLYVAMSRDDEALPLLHRALVIREKVLGARHPDTAASLNNLAELYGKLSRYNEALPLHQQALAIREVVLGTDHPDTAMSLNNLAELYVLMGRYDDALPLHQWALAVRKMALGADHPDTAMSLNNLAQLYRKQNRYDKALPLQLRALAIRKWVLGEDHRDTGGSLNNLAQLYELMERYDDALPLFRQALAINERVLGADHPVTANSLNSLAWLYTSMGRYDEALPLFRRAVRIVAIADVRDTRRDHGAVLHVAVFSANLAGLLAKSQDAGRIDEAIFYYKLSVNARQRMRAGTRGLDAAMRDSFTQKVASPYRALAELLIQRGRIAEAERVLLLLKEADLIEYVRRNGSDATAQPGLKWTAEEEAYRQKLDDVAGRWRVFEDRRRALADEVTRGSRGPDDSEVTQLDSRRAQLEASTTAAMQEAGRRFVDAAQAAHVARVNAYDAARTELATKLAEIHARGDGGLPTAGLLLLPGERGLNLIVTTENGAVPLMHKVSEKELNSLVQALRAAIRDRTDYQPAAQALYAHLIAPAEAQLGPNAGMRQWAILPYGSLREVPFVALQRPDGSFLVEHYAVTMLTADGTSRLAGLETAPRPTWQGVALGASRADPEFGNVALPGVTREVCGVVRAAPDQACRPGEGSIGGRRYLNDGFTPEVLQGLFGSASGGASFLHIATHFKLEKSLLLLGDGSKLSTADILKWTPRLGQYDLIALSACDSGVSEGGVESLGGVFRAQGAKAVLATLWPVADVGAAPLMVEFYRLRGEQQAMSKSAALQGAQQAILKGRIKDASGKADLRHPYFWAPYVLMGNWL
jgi:CHAT domain-containing protein/tetratricopeptide (TPR) repeat protein